MTTPPLANPEVLRAQPRPWLRRLWVRISLVLLLIGAICVASWWWPRRAIVAVRWVGGHCSSATPHDKRTVESLDPAGVWRLIDYNVICWMNDWLLEDLDIKEVGLSKAKVGDECLRPLRRFPKLMSVSLHDRQLGPGLDHLRDCAQMKHLFVQSASKGHLAHLRRLPQLERIWLVEPQAGDLGLNVLTALPKLDGLIVSECRSTNEVLAAIPELPQLVGFELYKCTGFVADDLRHLQRLRNLKFIDITGQIPLGDVALEHLSQLEHLERLNLSCRPHSVTPIGLRALSQMKTLTSVNLWGTSCTPEQVKLLRDQLPNCTIRVQ